MNQRPIGRIPNDPDDGPYLCPNDMLLGRATSEIPQGPFFPALVPRKKWHVENRNVQVDDVVTVADSNAVRGKWAESSKCTLDQTEEFGMSK